jgi:ribonuclease HII
MPRNRPIPRHLALARFDLAECRRHGARLVAGVDEAGRGALAGPVVAAIVVFDLSGGPHDGGARCNASAGRDESADCRAGAGADNGGESHALASLEGLNDSKQLSPAKREALVPHIHAAAHAVAVGSATAEEIDRINILQATLLAARRALDSLLAQGISPDLVLTDYLRLDAGGRPVVPLVKGDARSLAIAAASVIAKVTRDGWMRALDLEYPGYGLAGHKGYGSAAHLAALRERGASTVHRHTFRGVDFFDCEHRPSLTLGHLLEDLAAGRLTLAAARAAWAQRSPLLPECEDTIFESALAHLGR